MARKANEFSHFNLWIKVEVKDKESMSKKEWQKWLDEQRKALGKHFAKALHVASADITLGHIEPVTKRRAKT
jgi:hypothetical protein